jgi:hypothetical protein
MRALSRRAPGRSCSLRWQGRRLAVYRATLEAVRACWRRDCLDIAAMDDAAEEALDWLAGVELRASVERSRVILI